MANVAMMSVNSGALTMGRISVRSMSIPPTTPISSTPTNTTGYGSASWVRISAAYAPNVTISP